jgi:hypothetical protein
MQLMGLCFVIEGGGGIPFLGGFNRWWHCHVVRGCRNIAERERRSLFVQA